MTEEQVVDLENEDEELFEHHRFKADPGQEAIRIDKFLIDRMANTSRNKIQVAAKNGNILVNGIKVKQNYKIKQLKIIFIKNGDSLLKHLFISLKD